MLLFKMLHFYKMECTKGDCQEVCCVNEATSYLKIVSKTIFFQLLHFRKFVTVHNVAHLLVD